MPASVSKKTILAMATLFIGLSLGTYACSSDDDRQDQNYGTDAGADFKGPEVGFDTASSTQSDKDAKSGDDGSLDTNSDGTTKDTAGTADATVDLGTTNATGAL
jgi:hypothetical protein